MSKIKIITDSASDITREEAERYNIHVMSFTINMDGQEYRTGIDISAREFYEKLKTCKELPTTSQLPPQELYEVFKKYTDEGYEVLFIAISSNGSGIYNSANIAKGMVLDENLDAVIELLDSRRFAYIYAYAAIEAARLAEQGEDIETIKQAVTELLDSYDVYIIAQSLEYLEKGGRINKASLVFGNLLDIRPLLSIRNGLIEAIDKIRGSKKIVQKLFRKLSENGYDQAGKTMIIVQGDMEAEALEIKALIEENLKPKEIILRDVGPTIGTHIGPVLGVFFKIK